MNFNALKIILKIHKKKLGKIQAWYSHKGMYLWPSTYMQDMREIPAIVTEKIVIKCCNFHTFVRDTSLGIGSSRETNRQICMPQTIFHP